MNDLIGKFTSMDFASMINDDNQLLIIAGCLVFGAVVIYFIKKNAFAIMTIVGAITCFKFGIFTMILEEMTK